MSMLELRRVSKVWGRGLSVQKQPLCARSAPPTSRH
jgi:hypothetical protein